MVLTTDEVLSLAAGELLSLRREPRPIRLRCAPKPPVRHRKPGSVKFRHAPRLSTLSQTSELRGWLDQVLPADLAHSHSARLHTAHFCRDHSPEPASFQPPRSWAFSLLQKSSSAAPLRIRSGSRAISRAMSKRNLPASLRWGEEHHSERTTQFGEPDHAS